MISIILLSGFISHTRLYTALRIEKMKKILTILIKLVSPPLNKASCLIQTVLVLPSLERAEENDSQNFVLASITLKCAGETPNGLLNNEKYHCEN